MNISPAELAALPTAPAVSKVLYDAAAHAADGPIIALCRSAYGSADPSDYAAIVSPEHVLAWSTALIAAARIVDPAVCGEWPDESWDEYRSADVVGRAHRLVTGWASGTTPEQLALLFRTAARDVREAEAAA